MKVAIITLNSTFNLGNRLQNYAVQTVLKRCGSEVTTIIYHDSSVGKSTNQKIKFFVKSVLTGIGIAETPFFAKYIQRNNRTFLFTKFNKKYISQTRKYYFKMRKMGKYNKDFDYYCVGSDQIWAFPVVNENDFLFLQFAPPSRTFSFSASMGTTDVPEKGITKYAEGLKHIGNISVREEDMKPFIKTASGRDSTVLLDPTMLLSKKEWLSLSNAPKIDMPSKYIATYFLSPITESQKSFINEYAQRENLKVIDIEQSYYDKIGPSEFIYLIANASFIFTDSFHGTAFSLIFNKDFLAFQRNFAHDMSSRITTILKKFKLEERFLNTDNYNIDDSFYSLIDHIKSQDTSYIEEIIFKEQILANQFIKKSLSQKE